jgi:SAM-dependent methyltransferase
MHFQKTPADPCPLCKEKGSVVLFQAKDHQDKVSGLFQVAQCGECGLIFLNPMPAGREIESYYAVEDLYPYSPVTTSSLRRLKNSLLAFCAGIYFRPKKNAIHKAAALLFLPIRKKLIPMSPFGHKVLDIGCGNGAYLMNLREIGWDVYGCELSKSGATIAVENGLDVVQGNVFDACYPDSYFDVVRLEQVFEHIHDPDSLLKEVRRILKPSGLLMIGVPHGHSLSFKIFGQYWGLLGLPFHLFQYSSTTLQKILSRNGFRVVEFRYIPTLQCWLWSLNNFLSEKFSRTEGSFLNDQLFIWTCRLSLFPLLRLLFLFHPAWADMIEVLAQQEVSSPTSPDSTLTSSD